MLLIYLEVAGQPSFEYQKEIVQWTKEYLPHVTTIDLDNFSDSSLFEQVISLIEKEDKSMVVYNIREEVSSDQVVSLTNAVLDFNDRTRAILNGKHTFIERLLNVLDEKHIKNPTEEEKREYLKKYFNEEGVL